MLPPVIFELWLGELGLGARLESFPPDDLAAARAYWGELSKLGMDQIDESIAAGDKEPLRRLAWFLLASACAYVARGEITPATGFQRWAEAAANHSTDDIAREEGLLAHTIFFRGVLAYHRNELDEAMTAYAQAQDLYDAAKEGRVLVGVAILAQATIEVELAERDRSLTSASSRCVRGLALLGELADRGEEGTSPRARIDRLIAQRRWASELIAGVDDRRSVNDRPDLFDAHIALLVGRRLRDRLAEGEIDGIYSLARLADAVAFRLEQPAHTVDAVLGSFLQAGRFDALEAFARAALADRPGDADLQRALSLAMGQQGRHEDVGLFLLELLASSEPAGWIHQDLATALTALGQTAEAKRHLELAEQLAPTTLTSDAEESTAGTTAEARGAVSGDEPAARAVVAFLRQSPAELVARLAELAILRPDLAVRVCELLEADGALPADGVPQAIERLRRAEGFYHDRQWEESIATYRQALEASPNFARAYQGIGKVVFGHGAFATAAAHFREAIEIKPAAETFRLLADCYRNLNALLTAVATYQLALTLDPNDSLARTDRDTILVKLGLTEGSTDEIAAGLSAMPPRDRSESETTDIRKLARQNLQASEQFANEGNPEGAIGLDLRSLDAVRATAHLEDAIAAISYHLGVTLSRMRLFHAALAAHRDVLSVSASGDNPFGFLAHLAIGVICAERPDLGDPVLELEAALRASSAPTKDSLDPLAWRATGGAWYLVLQPAPAHQAATLLAQILASRGDQARAETLEALAGKLAEVVGSTEAG